MEKDLPTLREIAGNTWKKEDELKGLKSEVVALERSIQIALTPPETTTTDDTELAQKAVEPAKEDTRPLQQLSLRNHS